MTNEQKQLLLRALELSEALPAVEPEKWQLWEYDSWADEMTNGPRYLVTRWFGPLRERDRMRYRRAIDVLECQGLVKTHRAWGTRLTNLKLTDAGQRAAQQLRAEASDVPTTGTSEVGADA